jgi:putative ABC transport system permease protein
MGVLNRKLRRELWASRGPLAAVVAIITVGTGSFIGSGTAQRILETSQTSYYEQYRFADFWIDLKKAPLSAVERLSAMPEVAAVEGRVVFDVILDLPGIERPLSGRLISAPEQRLGSTINGVCLIQGDRFSRSQPPQAILGESFARAHGLRPGDRVGVLLNRRREEFVIAGTAITPEYAYMVQGEAGLLPDPRHFGIVYLEETQARELLDFQDACNQIVGQLTPQGRAHADEVLERLEEALAAYGVLATIPRARQPSHRFLSDEIRGLAVSTLLLPGTFLVVAALVFNSVMVRLAERQRTIIGTLKALGCRDREVLAHYLGFGVVIGLVSGVLGCATGLLLSWGLIEVYKGFYQFPRFVHHIYPDLLAEGLAVSVGFAILGTARGVWRIFRLQPAEAMRSRPPARGGRVWLQRWPRLWRALGFRWHMALRTVIRDRGRTLTGVTAAALSSMIIFLTLSLYAAVAFLVDFQFRHTRHSDVDIGLRDEQHREALREARRLPGVVDAQPLLVVVCDVRCGAASRRVAITGLAAGQRLTTPRQSDLSPIEIPARGLVMSRKLADLLGIEPGDEFEMVPVRGRRQPVRARLAATADTFLGLDCYAALDYLNEVVGESQAMNAVQLAVERNEQDKLFRTVKDMPLAQSLAVRADAVANIEDTLVRTIRFAYGLMIVFAGVIAFGSAINSSLLEIDDRLREISTLQVLGYFPRQVAAIFLRQNIIVAGIGLVAGLPLGWLALIGMARAYDTELFRIPVVFRPVVLIATVVIAVLFQAVAQVVVDRRIRRLDVQEGIKVKE